MAARRFPRGGVASPHYLASTAGLATLARGGNALDAAIAANLALGVVAPYLCGYGGDVFAIVWDGELHGYLGSGRSPGRGNDRNGPRPCRVRHDAGTRSALRHGAGRRRRMVRPPRAVGDQVVRRAGGARARHTPATDSSSRRWARCILGGSLAMYEGSAALRSTYEGVEAGKSLRQPGLARTIETLAADGPDAYYRGPIADAIAETRPGARWLAHRRGSRRHEGRWVAPLRAPYRDVEIAELPPPTQGVDRARGAAHPGRLPAARGRARPPPPPDRSHQARPPGPQRVRLRSGQR